MTKGTATSGDQRHRHFYYAAPIEYNCLDQIVLPQQHKRRQQQRTSRLLRPALQSEEKDMEPDLGEEWVIVPRDDGGEVCNRDHGGEVNNEDHHRHQHQYKSSREQETVPEEKTWEELVALEEASQADEVLYEGHRWRKYV